MDRFYRSQMFTNKAHPTPTVPIVDFAWDERSGVATFVYQDGVRVESGGKKLSWRCDVSVEPRCWWGC